MGLGQHISWKHNVSNIGGEGGRGGDHFWGFTITNKILRWFALSITQYYISLYLGWELYDQYRNTNVNNKDHLIGRFTRLDSPPSPPLGNARIWGVLLTTTLLFLFLFNLFNSNSNSKPHDQNKYFNTWSARPSAFSFPSLLFLERAWKLYPSPIIAKKFQLFIYSIGWWIII